MLAVVLALGCSVAYGTANFLGPRLVQRHSLAVVLLVGQLAALVVAVALVAAAGDAAPSTDAVLLGLLAGAGNAMGLAGLYRATMLGPVSVAVSIGATGTLLPVLFGLARGDKLSGPQLVGVALAIAGASLAAGPGRDGRARPAATGWALVSAVGFGVLLIALPEAAEEGTTWALLDARIAVVVLVAAGIALFRAPIALPTAALPAVAVPGLLLISGTLLYAEAAARGELSVVSVLSSLATVVTVTLAFVLLGERLARVQRIGVAAAALGTLLLAL